jgi:hypothetical protein
MDKVWAALVAAVLVTGALMASVIVIGSDVGVEVGALIGAVLFVGVASMVLIAT